MPCVLTKVCDIRLWLHDVLSICALEVSNDNIRSTQCCFSCVREPESAIDHEGNLADGPQDAEGCALPWLVVGLFAFQEHGLWLRRMVSYVWHQLAYYVEALLHLHFLQP